MLFVKQDKTFPKLGQFMQSEDVTVYTAENNPAHQRNKEMVLFNLL